MLSEVSRDNSLLCPPIVPELTWQRLEAAKRCDQGVARVALESVPRSDLLTLPVLRLPALEVAQVASIVVPLDG